MTKRAIIFGVSGQDGAYLAQKLIAFGYEVHGTSRDIERANLQNVVALGISAELHVHSASLLDHRSVVELLRLIQPREIYNLSAQSSVGLSFQQPIETLNSIANATMNLLEAVRLELPEARVYNASSSEMFGDTKGEPANEETAFRPRSPYGISKAASHWLVQSYRQAYGLHASSGILFNHESPLRSARFVTQKIARGAVDIKMGLRKELFLGDLSIVRDWGWAPEYVDAMWRMLQLPSPVDLVVATGLGATLEEFVQLAFGKVDLDWREYVRTDPSLARPYEVRYTVGNPSKAEQMLSWRASKRMPDVVAELIEAELRRASATNRG